jgi:hypothetical protein
MSQSSLTPEDIENIYNYLIASDLSDELKYNIIMTQEIGLSDKQKNDLIIALRLQPSSPSSPNTVGGKSRKYKKSNKKLNKKSNKKPKRKSKKSKKSK